MIKKLKNINNEHPDFLRKSINGCPVYPFGSGWKDAEGRYYHDTIDGIVPEEWCVEEEYSYTIRDSLGNNHVFYDTRYRKSTYADD